MRRAGLVYWVILLLLVGALGAGAAQAQSPRMPVAASILPLADFCRQIGGDKVEVQLLIPSGASPHAYEPSPGTLAGLARARVLAYVGAGLEPWIDKFLKTLKDPKPAVVAATEGIALITDIGQHVQGMAAPLPQHRHPEEADGLSTDAPGHGHGAGNPHVWLDPIMAQDICRRLAAAFIRMDPANQTVYEQNLQEYLAKLADLHQKIVTETAAFRLKEYIGFHPSFAYFARRYNLREAGIIEMAPGREPTPRALRQIMAAIRHYGIKVIFAEPQFSSRIAEVLAKEAGVQVLFLDPIGGRPPYGDNYLKMMQYNVETMAKAMK